MAKTLPILPSFLRSRHTRTVGIRDAAYVPERRELRITFTSGRTFAYGGVPQGLYDAFMQSPSRTAFFNIAIRGRFQFREIEPQTPPTMRH
jgi:hypothetical protein